jgi:hypothetical protein
MFSHFNFIHKKMFCFFILSAKNIGQTKRRRMEKTTKTIIEKQSKINKKDDFFDEKQLFNFEQKNPKTSRGQNKSKQMKKDFLFYYYFSNFFSCHFMLPYNTKFHDNFKFN